MQTTHHHGPLHLQMSHDHTVVQRMRAAPLLCSANAALCIASLLLAGGSRCKLLHSDTLNYEIIMLNILFCSNMISAAAAAAAARLLRLL
jgi:hypothetical protein